MQVVDSFKPDVRVLNVETAITTSEKFYPRKGIHYRCSPKNAEGGMSLSIGANRRGGKSIFLMWEEPMTGTGIPEHRCRWWAAAKIDSEPLAIHG